MRTGHVLYLSSAGCALWSRGRSEFVPGRVHTVVGEDPRRVVAELEGLPPAPVAVLVDMIDEEHLRDTVPRLGRRDQQAVLARKLARAFPRTSYRCAILQGRSESNPDEDHALLCALTRPEPLRVLMQRLTEARIPVSIVVSPALLVGELLDAPAREAEALFMVLRRGNGRLQHSFFRQGRLVGSRRLRAGSEAHDESAESLVRQIEESLRYFDATFAPGAQQPLEIRMPDGDYACIAEGGFPEGWQPARIDMAELRKRLRIGAGVDIESSERLFIELLFRRVARVSYAPPAEQRYHKLSQVRRMARAAGFLAAAAGIAGTLWNTLVIADVRQRLAMFELAAGSLETVLSEPVTAPQPGVSDPMQMQQVVLTHDALAARDVEPERIFAAVSAATTARNHIRIDAIAWSLPDDVPEAPAEGEESGAGAEDPAEAPAPVSRGIAVTVKGHVDPFDGDYPGAFREVEAFMAELQRHPAVQDVAARTLPLDVSPQSTLSGEVTPGSVPHDAAFAIEIILRRPDATL